MSLQSDIDTILGEVSDNIKIDVDTLNTDAEEYSKTLIKDVTQLFQDEEWMKAHPQMVSRLNIELESLRGLIKMRKADEYVHDALLAAISSNNLNASLYRSLSEIQKTSLNITTKINETIVIINNLMRGFQLDLPFKDDDSNTEIYRGSKDFIKEMNKEE